MSEGVSDPSYHVREPVPELHEPILIVALSGWIDASGTAAAAMEALQEELGAEQLVDFDDDVFIDFRARRPTMELRDGLNTRLVWNSPEILVGTDGKNRDVLLLTGPEPDMAWRRFADAVGELAERFGVGTMIGLGAYPFATPHTRPARVSCTSPSVSVLERMRFLKSSVDVPAGTEALLEHALHERGIDAVGLWVQVPHYVAAMAYPAATAALIDAVNDVTGLSLGGAAVRREAMIQRERLDTLVRDNEEHLGMLRQLEAAYDATEEAVGFTAADLPSGDELAQELETFLREHGGER